MLKYNHVGEIMYGLGRVYDRLDDARHCLVRSMDVGKCPKSFGDKILSKILELEKEIDAYIEKHGDRP